MTEHADRGVPQSPEDQPAAVREELDQHLVTHEGTPEPANPESASQHLGANEEQMTPVVPPMRGPGNLVGAAGGAPEGGDLDDDGIDPVDEMTPG